MKKIVATLYTVCAFSLFSSAQSYKPIPDTNAFWKEVTVFFLPGNPSNTVRDEFVKGDTVIGSYSYTKVYATGYVHDNTSTIYFTNAYQGAVRDDSVTQHVYFVPAGDTTEQLLYDFSLTVGQQTPASDVYYSQYTITSIDSIYYLNGWHERFHTGSNGPNGELMFIEGMGSNYGLTLCYCSSLQKMDCFYQDDRPCWPDTSSGCASPVGIPEAQVTNGLIIAPVPSSHFVTVRSGKDGIISVFNQMGETVAAQTIFADVDLNLDITQYAKGVYLLVCVNSDGVPVSGKFIVQ